MVPELLEELLELLPESELPKLPELPESPELPELPEDRAEDDALLPEEAGDCRTVVCVDPGSTAATTPAATTLANDTVMVAVFKRRLPCSRSATACASRRAAAWPAERRALA